MVKICDKHSCFGKITKPSKREGDTSRIRKYMPGERFEQITAALIFTNKPIQQFWDIFNYIRHILDAFNICNFFFQDRCPLLVSTFSYRLKSGRVRYFWPLKSHPYGKKYHYIADRKYGIMYVIEIVEGKDIPTQLVHMEFNKEFGTKSLLQCQRAKPPHPMIGCIWVS